MTIETIKGTGLVIKVGDGASPEVFTAKCLINAKRGIKFAASSNKIVVPDCDNPDDPAWQEVVKDALSCSIDGAGKLNTSDVDEFHNWLISPNPKNCEIYLGAQKKWSGAFHCTSFEANGDRGQYAECAIALESHREIALTPDS